MGRPWKWLAVFGGAASMVGCATTRPGVQTTTPTHPAEPAHGEDPTEALIKSAENHLQAGIAENQAGHLNSARDEFDRALDVYLTAPGGAYGSPRLAESYRHTLETIQRLEVQH